MWETVAEPDRAPSPRLGPAVSRQPSAVLRPYPCVFFRIPRPAPLTEGSAHRSRAVFCCHFMVNVAVGACEFWNPVHFQNCPAAPVITSHMNRRASSSLSTTYPRGALIGVHGARRLGATRRRESTKPREPRAQRVFSTQIPHASPRRGNRYFILGHWCRLGLFGFYF